MDILNDSHNNFRHHTITSHSDTLRSLHSLGLCVPGSKSTYSIDNKGENIISNPFNQTTHCSYNSEFTSFDDSEGDTTFNSSSLTDGRISFDQFSELNNDQSNLCIENSKDEDQVNVPYSKLVTNAICQAPEGCLILSDIYKYVIKNYPQICRSRPAWRISIRHQLSTNSCFVKMSRGLGQRGSFWSMHPACKDESGEVNLGLIQGLQRKRKRRLLRPTAPKLTMSEYNNTSYDRNAYVSMKSSNIGPDHPFYFLTEPKHTAKDYKPLIKKHNQLSWSSECSAMALDTCPCEIQKEIREHLPRSNHHPLHHPVQRPIFVNPIGYQWAAASRNAGMNHFTRLAQSYAPVCSQQLSMAFYNAGSGDSIMGCVL